MRASTTLARQIGRISQPLASASRPRVVPATATSAVRAIVTIPHPSLEVEGGQTRFVIKVFDHMATIVDSLAVLRAAEAQLGPILKVDVPKDPSTKRPTNTLFVTTLKPVVFDKSAVFEIPAPHRSPGTGPLGGASLPDVIAALHPAPADARSPRSAAGQPLKFRIEPRNSEAKQRPLRGIGANVTPTEAERAEDDRIVRALREFDGFYGGFAGIADNFASLVRERDVAVVEEAAEAVEEVAVEEEEVVAAAAEVEAQHAATAPATPAPVVPEAAPTPRGPRLSPKEKEQRKADKAKAREQRARDKAMALAIRQLKQEEAAAAAAATRIAAEAEAKPAKAAEPVVEPVVPEEPAPEPETGVKTKGAWGWVLPRRK
ncbi:uncharacterized protein LOC62_05G006862 [Vanrija pseudolonga]|uniref:Uncharacterized protein n=1 Tax=Vanrija pseudolonga TaxID=143232 RepID=A0AAF0YB09_9TREE|nr:hypothetical protein LOC62_05G006862 [Vanrija pseudolonga]